MHVVVYFKCLPQICTKMNGFKFDFSKIFWGGAHRASSPDPSPRFFSGFALGSGFALNSQALRAFESGFALDSRALRALDSGFALNFRLKTWFGPPQNKFLDPPLRMMPLWQKVMANGARKWRGPVVMPLPR